MGAVQPFISGAISKTVNMPEEVTVEEVEQLHQRRGSSGSRPSPSTATTARWPSRCRRRRRDDKSADAGCGRRRWPEGSRIVEKIVHKPFRQKLPRTRSAKTFEFRVADCKGFVTVGEYDSGQPGEIFITVSKQGSTLAGIMDAFAKAISYGLQYGVPLRGYVETFANMKFEPAGMTDDPTCGSPRRSWTTCSAAWRSSTLTYDERAELGIFTVAERTQPTLPGVDEAVIETHQGRRWSDPKTVPSVSEPRPARRQCLTPRSRTTPRPPWPGERCPLCMQCGVQMVRAGTCHACPSCGNTSGCADDLRWSCPSLGRGVGDPPRPGSGAQPVRRGCCGAGKSIVGV